MSRRSQPGDRQGEDLHDLAGAARAWLRVCLIASVDVRDRSLQHCHQLVLPFVFSSSRRRHTRSYGDWSSDVCSSDLEDGALVGMGSIVMNGARIGRGSIVGAGSVITEGKQFPEHSLIIGAPARVIRTLEPAQVAAMGSAAKFYVGNGPRFRKGLTK